MTEAVSRLTNRLAALALRHRLLWGLCVVLAVVCVIAAVRVVIVLVGEPAPPQLVLPRAGGDAVPQRLTLFRAPAGSQEQREELDEATVNAELVGVIRRGSQAFASLRVNGNREAVFKVNDSLVDGVTVDAIEPTRVVVRERGQLKSITLKSLLDDRNGGQFELASSDPQPIAAEQAPPVVLTPVMTDSGVSGMRIDQMGEAVAALGLFQTGDTLIAVAGQPLAEVLANPDLRASLAAQSQVSVTVERQGVEQDLDVDPASLNALMTP